jgi:hypothetical protein
MQLYWYVINMLVFFSMKQTVNLCLPIIIKYSLIFPLDTILVREKREQQLIERIYKDYRDTVKSFEGLN